MVENDVPDRLRKLAAGYAMQRGNAEALETAELLMHAAGMLEIYNVGIRELGCKLEGAIALNRASLDCIGVEGGKASVQTRR